MLNLRHWFCVFPDPFFGRRNNNPAFNLKIVLNIFWKLCLELSFFIKIGRIFKFYCMILLVGYWILNVFKSWWYLDFLTAHAWVSGPDLAPQKILLSQQFRYLMRWKKYLKKIFLSCLVSEIQLFVYIFSSHEVPKLLGKYNFLRSQIWSTLSWNLNMLSFFKF